MKRSVGTLFGKVQAETKPSVERHDVPPAETRWVWRRKAQVVTAVDNGLLSLDEACRRYEMSIEEFRSWQKTFYFSGERKQRAVRASGMSLKG